MFFALHIASGSCCHRGKLYILHKYIISYVRVSIIQQSNTRANARRLGRCTYSRPDLVESLLTTAADSTSCSTLAITFLRCFVRLKIEARALTSSDYLVWGGWFFTLAWVSCQCHALYIEIDHPITDDYYSDSVDYLKV
jgi:hypothetical protein